MFIKARMEYRFSFFVGMFANLYYYFITYTTFWVITQQFGTIDGWDFNEISVLFGIYLLAYSISGVFFWYTVFHIDREITSGNLDNYLIRPLGIIKQMICKRFGDTFLGQIVIALVFMVMAVTKINYYMTVFSYIYLILSIFSGILLLSGAMIILGSLSFWMLRSGDLSNILYYDIRTFIYYPLSIYPSFIRMILTYIWPLAIVNYYPSLIILHKVQTVEEFALSILSPIIGILFFLLSLFIFNRGLRRYTGSGS